MITDTQNVAGPVLAPGDPEFSAEVAAFDASLHHRPQAAIGATSTADVAAAVALARRSQLPLYVMGTGHADIPAIGDDALLLTTRRMTGVTIDPDLRTATVAAGTRWSAVVAAAAPHGLAPLCGSAPEVGVVGFVLGGGSGPIGRTFGYTADLVRSFELVTADGSVIEVTARQEPELFWALRGGKGGFGVVTAVTIDLLPLTTIFGGGLYFRAEDIPVVLDSYRDYVAAEVPIELTTSLALLRLPDIPVLPTALRGQTVAHLRVGFVGEEREAEPLLRPLLAAADPVSGALATLPYERIGTIHADPVRPIPHRCAGTLLHSFDADAAAAVLGVAGPDTGTTLTLLEVRHLGGAFAAPSDGTPSNAVGGREAEFGVWITEALSAESSEVETAAVDARVGGAVAALRPWSTRGVQINFAGNVNTSAELDRAWSPATAARLQELRRATDPDGRLPWGFASLESTGALVG